MFLQERWKWENPGEGLSPSCGAQEKLVAKTKAKEESSTEEGRFRSLFHPMAGANLGGQLN